jgi:hypothetical protein
LLHLQRSEGRRPMRRVPRSPTPTPQGCPTARADPRTRRAPAHGPARTAACECVSVRSRRWRGRASYPTLAPCTWVE